jgi:hypothetical protein
MMSRLENILAAFGEVKRAVSLRTSYLRSVE